MMKIFNFTLAIVFLLSPFTSQNTRAMEESYFDRFEDRAEFYQHSALPRNELVPDAEPPIDLLKGTGNWTFIFEFIANNGKPQVLTSFQPDQLFKPASNQKLFTSLWAYQKKARSNAYLSQMLHQSVNEMADATFRLLGGASAMKKHYLNLGFPVDRSHFIPVDGSGLSYSNQVTANFEMDLLEYIYTSSFYHSYKELLAQPAEVGTLETRLLEYKDRLFAKTGTLDDTAALSGFLEFKTGTLLFVMISNQLKVPVPDARKLIDTVVRMEAKPLELNDLNLSLRSWMEPLSWKP